MVTLQILEHNASSELFNILSRAESRSNDPDSLGLPSWVPDYTLAPSSQSISSNGGDHFDTGLLSSHSPINFKVEGSRIHVSGAMFDTIQETVDLDDLEDLSLATSFAVLKLCLNSQQDRYSPGISRLEVLWRTLILNITKQKEYPAPSSLQEQFFAFMNILFAMSISNSVQQGTSSSENFQVLSSLLQQFGDKIPPKKLDIFDIKTSFASIEKIEQADVQTRKRLWSDSKKIDTVRVSFNYMIQVNRLTPDQAFFRTTNGFLGLGPSAAMEGDQVWVFPGAIVPFVLHPLPAEDTFTLVGEAYMHGFMHGEMLQGPYSVKKGVKEIAIV